MVGFLTLGRAKMFVVALDKNVLFGLRIGTENALLGEESERIGGGARVIFRMVEESRDVCCDSISGDGCRGVVD